MPLSSKVKQVLGAVCANLLTMSLGASMGWESSAFKLLESNRSDLRNGPLTSKDLMWIHSLYSFGGLLGSLIYGYISDKIGRKNAITTIAVPQVISYLLVVTGNTVTTITISRLLIGFSAGALFIASPLYVSEIAENKIRGALGSLFIVTVGIGVCFAYILGAFLDYRTCCLVYMLFPMAFIIVSFILPETPFYLAKKENFEEAEKSLMFYRGTTMMEGKVLEEFEELKHFVGSNNTEEKVVLADFLTKSAKKAILIGMVLVWLERYSGCYSLLFYAAKIFQKSGTSLDPEIAAIVLGLIQVVGAYCSTFLVDRTGRRFLLLLSSSGIAVGMILFGAATQLIEFGYNSDLMRLIPVFAFSFSIFIANVGVFTMTFIVLSEISPPKVKSYIFTMCMLASWTITFSVFAIIDPIEAWIGQGGLMYFFAICSSLGGLFVFFYLPETVGRSFNEISKIMEE